MKNCGDNVFKGIPVGADEPSLFSATSLLPTIWLTIPEGRVRNDIKKFARWFTASNGEWFTSVGSRPETLPTSEIISGGTEAKPWRRSTATWSPFAASSAGWLNMDISPPIQQSRSRN